MGQFSWEEVGRFEKHSKATSSPAQGCKIVDRSQNPTEAAAPDLAQNTNDAEANYKVTTDHSCRFHAREHSPCIIFKVVHETDQVYRGNTARNFRAEATRDEGAPEIVSVVV